MQRRVDQKSVSPQPSAGASHLVVEVADDAPNKNSTARANSGRRKTTDFTGRTCCEPSFQPPLRADIATIVFPGFLAAYGQACKYTGPDAVTVLDKHDRTKVIAKVTCAFSPRVLHNVVPAPDIRENELGWSFNPVGFMSCLKTWGTKAYFRMPDLPMMHTVAHLNNMGGYDDQRDCVTRIEEGIAYVDAAAAAARAAAEEGEGDAAPQKIVLFGFSRGAATVMHTALKLRKELADRIALVVCEAPFDTFDGVIDDSSWFPWVNRTAFKKLCKLSDPSAYEMPPTTNLTCPIAFITSNGDTRVPPRTTQRCIDGVRRLYPHLVVEHLSLARARHPVMTYSHEDDRDAYIAFMERLYDTYVSVGPVGATAHRSGVSSQQREEDVRMPDADSGGLVPAL